MNGYSVSEEDKTNIRKLFDKTDEDVKEQVKCLQEWTESVPHLPEESRDEDFVNIMLLRSKFREDFAKRNIENYFKCMNKYPGIFRKLGKFKPSEQVGTAVASTKLTPNYERIGILKLLPNNKTKKIDVSEIILVTVTTGMIMYNNDYVPSVRFILDFLGFSIWNLFRVNIRELIELVYICENMLRIRISGFELLNAPRIVTGLLSIAKVLLKPKMFSRITTHASLESLYENIPRECLPSDYGGESESTDQLVELWDEIIASQQPFFDRIASYANRDTTDDTS